MSRLVSFNQQESKMQRALLNRATMRVADRTDVSGRVTADEVNLDRFHNRIREVRLIAGTWLASVTVSLGLYLGLTVCGLAQNDQGQNNQGFLDPFVGSWLVHATVDMTTISGFPPLPFEFDALEANFEDGTVIATVVAGAPAHGVWKRSALPRTYDVKFLYFPSGPQYPPGTIGTGRPGPLVLNQAGTQLTGPFYGFDTAPDGTVIDTLSGTVVIDRISFSSTP
jgi:hypothetical protein